MGPLLYMWSVLDQNAVMRRMNVNAQNLIIKKSNLVDLLNTLKSDPQKTFCKGFHPFTPLYLDRSQQNGDVPSRVFFKAGSAHRSQAEETKAEEQG